MEFQDDAAEFVHDDVETILKNSIQHCLADHHYNLKKVNDWTNHIVDNCLKELQQLNRPFKYIVTCIIMQNNGAGMNTAASMLWDGARDGRCQVPYVTNTMVCIVTVYGLAVHIDDGSDHID